MRLSKIKLAGFKSFVDPTTINFPSNLTGIVGPNGCGKSNTIDAVRWVMGESSAKNLRGTSMDDVIFNGSTARKPVGMATVELIFDNSDGKMGGQYAQYAEISVKRSVTRDGASKYTLNGTRCRRRDVADLFLGTGLGPRSYAIIEQGMISRLIDAKPEELRTFLEEAAGISKYKERRRETENRIRHTRENLERLTDLREEIDKQLARLQRQSRSAERYKDYKQQERVLKAEHLVLHWQALTAKLSNHDQAISQLETELEKVIAEQRAAESQIEQQRQHNESANNELNQAQGAYYSLGADISAKEQNIQYQQNLQQRQQTDLERVESSLADAQRVLEGDRQALQAITQQLQTDEPELDQLKRQEAVVAEQLQTSEQRMQSWQQSWDEINRDYSQASQKAQVERSRMEQLERHVSQLQQRLQKIDHERQALYAENLDDQISDLQHLHDKASEEKTGLEQQLSETLNNIQQQREAIVKTEQQSAQARRHINQLQGQLSSLEALQQAALGKTNKALQQWLDKNGLSQNVRVAQQLDVEQGWELAVETVLGDTLEAVCIENLSALDAALQPASLEAMAQSNLFLLEMADIPVTDTSLADLLLQKVNTSLPIMAFLQGIYTAETLAEALSKRDSLKPAESIVTRDGIWVGANWLRISRDKDARQGVLAREQTIRELQQQLAEHEVIVQQWNTALSEYRQALQTDEQQRETLQASLNTIHSRLNDIQAQISARQSRQQHIIKRTKSLDEELAETGTLITSEESAIALAIRSRNEALAQAETMETARSELQSQREQLNRQLQTHRNAMSQQRESAHQLAIKIEGLRSRMTGLAHNISRMEQNWSVQQQRKQELDASLQSATAPVEALETELKTLLDKRLQAEQHLSEARKKLEAITHKRDELDKQRLSYEQAGQQLRSKLEQKRLDSQELRVRAKTALEQLAETGFELDEVAARLEQGADCQQWEQKLADISQRIARLGPINLAAIDEYKEQQTRKIYLDEQNNDVVAALDILQQAIAKIDSETRSRFKETYDHVNNRVKDMFPRLFGGGTAYLEMTGDDLLNTGVAIMARPPGKRISNIHLMSGGEKALTAVALVFAIFELNPAPFCMLDEVDAPLDEANVGRFCQLVKEMSSQVQFIFITHNKNTMEISEHLSGVTMRESGVSRLVSVDVAEAATLAGVGA